MAGGSGGARGAIGGPKFFGLDRSKTFFLKMIFLNFFQHSAVPANVLSIVLYVLQIRNAEKTYNFNEGKVGKVEK